MGRKGEFKEEAKYYGHKLTVTSETSAAKRKTTVIYKNGREKLTIGWKVRMRRILYTILPFLRVACSLAPGRATTPTESDFEQTKFFPMTREAETVTAGYPKNDATITAIMATKYTGGTEAAATMTAIPSPHSRHMIGRM